MRDRPLVCFIAVFFIVLFALQFITHLPSVARPLTLLTTYSTKQVLQWIGLPVSVETVLGSYFIHSARGIRIEIIYECTGIYGIIVFLSALWATPTAHWHKKLIGTWLGIFFLWGVNLIRLVSIYWITYEYPPLFDFIHAYLWQLFLIIMVILAYGVWYKKATTSYQNEKEK